MPQRQVLLIMLAMSVVVGLASPPKVLAVGSGPAPAPVAPRSAEDEYNKGLQNKTAKRFREAAADFRHAVAIRSDFPEAWNELGFALRQDGQYAEAMKAYDRALRLRPNYPEALEYLGEAYVKMGRLDAARQLADRLRGLDAARAAELEEAIQTAKPGVANAAPSR